MEKTLALLGVLLGLLLVLEVLNALFDSVVQGIARDMARKEPVPVYLLPFALSRWLLALVAHVGRSTSLVVHELSHALAQFVFGGRPRVVFLKNGGYAQSQPWADAPPARAIFAVGSYLGRGVMCTAPILVSATLLVALLILTTPLSRHEVLDLGKALRAVDGHTVRDALGATGHAFMAARVWMYPIAIVVALLIAPGMTPSTVDYVHGRLHILAYALAALVCAGVAQHAPHALWFVAPIAAVLGFGAILRGPEWSRALLGGFGLGTGVLALVLAVVGRGDSTALLALQHGLGVLAFGLGIAALVFVVFVAAFIGLSLVSIRPRTLWYSLVAAPQHLIDLVRPFYTCDRCRIHYRGTCEGCGRTPDAPAPDAPA